MGLELVSCKYVVIASKNVYNNWYKTTQNQSNMQVNCNLFCGYLLRCNLFFTKWLGYVCLGV